MAITITIGGTDRTNWCDLKTILVENTVQENADTATMEVATSSTDGWRPKAGNEIVVSNGTTKEFAGIVENIYEEPRAANRLRYRLNCRDYVYLFDRRLVVEESSALAGSTAPTANQIVTGVVNSYTTGFTTTNVAAAPAVALERYDYAYPSSIIRKLADDIGYGWYIDYDKDVHFFASATLAAPVVAINLDTDTTNYGDFKVSETAAGVKNLVDMKNYKVATTVQWNRSFTGDGATRFFLLGQEPAGISSAQMTATVDGTAVALLTDFVDGAPGTATGTSSQLFVCYDNMGVRFSTGAAAMSSTQTLSVTFNYMQDTVSRVQDLASQTEMASREGGDGIHEYVISDPQMTASDGSDGLALARGTTILTRYAMPRKTGSFSSWTQGWRAGQSLVVNSTRRMNGDINGATIYVQQVRKRIANHPSGGSPTFRYEIEWADSVVGI